MPALPASYYAGTLSGIWNQPGEEPVGLLELRIDVGGTHKIVGANQINAQVFVLLDEVRKSGHQRTGRTVHSLERMDLADHLAGIHVQDAELRRGERPAEMPQSRAAGNRDNYEAEFSFARNLRSNRPLSFMVPPWLW